MLDTDIIRAWKDSEFRDALAAREGGTLPEHPSGAVEIPAELLGEIAGGSTEYLLSLGCCQGFTNECLTLTQGPTGCTGFCISIWLTTSSVCKPQQPTGVAEA